MKYTLKHDILVISSLFAIAFSILYITVKLIMVYRWGWAW